MLRLFPTVLPHHVSPMMLRLRAGLIVWLFFGFVPCAFSAEPEDRPSLEYRRWSGEINVPDPVAISVANNGDVYVTQTQRRKIQDLDIRAHSEWIPDDVGLSSIEDKRAFYHRVLAIGGDQATQSRHVEDLNQDGQHDYRDLTVISENIHRLVDRDQNGTADEINLFADGFQTEVTGIAAGVLHWDDSVYATIAPDVWKLTDTDGDGHVDTRQVIATGFGLHIAYGGHDMHGLTIGPDGKLYWSIGDKGISVTAPDGTRHQYPNQGGVMRCNLDGSDFEVFAHGLRNVQEFAFDPFGNMFGVDNDADKPGEKERFVWIVDQMDAGWRCNYQYRGDAYDPWVDEKLWEVAGDRHPAYIVPPIENYVDGPAGFKFNPGGALSAAYRDFFFLTSAPNGSQFAFRAERHGDSFRMKDEHRIGSGDPIVGIAFGPDGGLYGVDWGGGYPLNQTGSVIRIDVPADALTDADRALRASTRQWLQADLNGVSDQELVGMLSHEDQRVRMRAQFALVDRSQTSGLMEALSNVDAATVARLHGLWGLGQLARRGSVSPERISPFLNDSDAVVRAAAAKTLGEIKDSDPDGFVALLGDPDVHVRVHAALALGRRPTVAAVEPLLQMARSLKSDEHYLRHAIVTALSHCCTANRLEETVADPEETARICSVLALRRQSSPAVAKFLADPSTWVATEAARAIHDDFSIDAALSSLAESLDQERDCPEAMTRRSINSNFRLGRTTDAERLMRFASDGDRPDAMRLAAIEALSNWNDPPLLDAVDGRRRTVAEERSLDRDSVTERLAALVEQPDVPIRVAAVRAARRLELDLSVDALLSLVNDRETPESLRTETLQSLAGSKSRLDKESLIRLLVELSSDPSSGVASLSIESLAGVDPQRAIGVIADSVEAGEVTVRQACVRALAVIEGSAAEVMLVRLADAFADGSLDDAVRLEVWNALHDKAGQSPQLAERIQAINERPELAAIEKPELRGFAMAAAGGDAERGEAIFRTDLRAQCSRCHRIGKQGSNIGPELTRIARKRDAAHLLRAIVDPSADIEPEYRAQTFLLADGEMVQGVVKSENDNETVLVNSEGKEVRLATEEIEDVANAKSSLMPEMIGVLRPAEVRDLVAFLKTLR